MLITQRTPKIIIALLDHTKDQSNMLYEACKDAVYHNNTPINILKAAYILEHVQTLVKHNQCHQVEYEYCLRYLSELSGYSPVELHQRAVL